VRAKLFALALISGLALVSPSSAAPGKRSAVIDWSRTVVEMPSGGFRMGNPKAPVALIEYVSMTCPHCSRFDQAGVTPLITKYVKTGKVSLEFRNYVRDAFDLSASLIARCNGPKSYFPLTRALLKDQPKWVRKAMSAPRPQLDKLETLPQNELAVAAAGFAGFPQWAAARGLPKAKSARCLANTAEVDRLVEMTSAASTDYPDFQGTPTFVINGKIVELAVASEAEVWPALEKKLKEAL